MSADVVEVDQAATPAPADPEAPFGRRDDGTPYKRDPSFFAHLRKPAAGGRTTRRRGKTAPAGPKAPAPAPSRKPAGKPDYATRIVKLGAVGLALIPNPVDRQIAKAVLPGWAADVEAVAVAYPAFGEMLDRLLLGTAGAGPVMALGLSTATAVGLVALNHGSTHPLLVTMFGAQLQTLSVMAMQEQATHRAQEAELAAFMAEETARLQAETEE